MRIITVPPEAAAPTCGRRNAADYERHNAFLVFITNAAHALRLMHAADASDWSLRSLAKSAACGRRSGRRAADALRATMNGIMHFYPWSQMRPMHDEAAMRRPQRAADAPADYEPTFIVVRTCDLACHVLVSVVCMYTTRTKVKIYQSVRCTHLN